MDCKINNIIFNHNLLLPDELYNKYIIKPNFYSRMVVYFGLRYKYISNSKELYDYYIYLSLTGIL